MKRSGAATAFAVLLLLLVDPLFAQQPGGESKAPRTRVVPKKVAKSSAAVAPKPQGVEAKVIFGAMSTAAPLEARAIGFYSRGCLAGARPLSIDGPNWQAMRLSRNRNWGHPELIALIERLAKDVKAHDGWPGLLVGDLSQPRGGPMLTGHASHQIGLDADIWLTPMPNRRLSYEEREELAATSMLSPDGITVDPKIWTVNHARLILRAASYDRVERVLVHPGIKKALCLDPRSDPVALGKVRPYWGHHYHMHVRIGCPKDSSGCAPQPPVPADNGCGKEVDDWIALLRRPAKPVDPSAPKPVPKPGLTLDQLPAECRIVVEAGSPGAGARTSAKPGSTDASAARK